MAKVALVTGATGIVGSVIIEHILKNTTREEWSKVIAISRREPVLEHKDDRYVFLPIDLQGSEEEITNKLRDGGASDTTHVFYTAYVHHKKWDPNVLYESNVPMFKKFITAIDSIAPLERIELQTGCKYYGIHIGKCPTIIDDATPRYQEEPGQPDFYFGQEDFLKQFQRGKNWHYTIYRPNNIIGLTRGNGMSMAPTLAVYFTVQKHLGKKAQYPGNEISYKSIFDVSSSDLLAQFAVWASKLPAAENNDFLVIDHNTQKMTGEQLWKGIASYFGVEAEEPKFPKTGSEPKGTGHLLLENSVAEYMKDKKDVWREIAAKYSIDEKMFDYATFEFVDAVFSYSWPQHFQMTKATQIGWKMERDPMEGFIHSFDKMKKWKMIPSVN